MDLKKVLTVAGSDSSGGAGIQADLKTITAHKLYGMSVITALTAQNTMGVTGVLPTPPTFVTAQLNAVFDDITPDAVKIGMLANADIIHAVADFFKTHRNQPIVLDPVMVASSGSALLASEAVDALRSELLPLATLLTPNLPEAAAICGYSVDAKESVVRAAQDIYARYGCAVLIKGGHFTDCADDFLFDGKEIIRYPCVHIDNPNTHGTGCTLSAAIASNLAKGFSVCDAVTETKRYITGAIADMLDIGHGAGPVHHMWNL